MTSDLEKGMKFLGVRQVNGIDHKSEYAIYQNNEGFFLKPLKNCPDMEITKHDTRRRQNGYICSDYRMVLRSDLLSMIPGLDDILFTLHTKNGMWIEISRGKCEADGRSLINRTLEELDGISYKASVIRNRTTINKTFLDACGIEPGQQFHIDQNSEGNLILRPFMFDDISNGLIDTYKDAFSTLNVSDETKKSIAKARSLINFTSEKTMIESAKKAIIEINDKIAEIRSLINRKAKEA